jgi:hypothetical protein
LSPCYPVHNATAVMVRQKTHVNVGSEFRQQHGGPSSGTQPASRRGRCGSSPQRDRTLVPLKHAPPTAAQLRSARRRGKTAIIASSHMGGLPAAPTAAARPFPAFPRRRSPTALRQMVAARQRPANAAKSASWRDISRCAVAQRRAMRSDAPPPMVPAYIVCRQRGVHHGDAHRTRARGEARQAAATNSCSFRCVQSAFRHRPHAGVPPVT